MKTLFTLLLSIFLITNVNAQYQGYVSGGLSMTNTGVSQFNSSNYASLEVGVTKKEMSFGAIFGRSSLGGAFQRTDRIGDYFWELKASATKNLGSSLNGYVLLGYGGYFRSGNFIEYGAGLSYMIDDKFSFFLQYSNWDKVNFISPGICYTFNFKKSK